MTGPSEAAAEPPGFAPERTRLAWRRTTLSMTVVTVLVVRMALAFGVAGGLLAAAALAGWVAVTVATYPRVVGRRPAGGGRALPLVALATVGYAGLGVLLVVVTLGRAGHH